MKKKLSQAIAMATLVGVAGAANANMEMFVNGNGLGDVLLYPLYTAESGNDTYISLTNTTDKFKAVKVRMLEHKNSQEVRDFNLYLSPYDQWSAAITLNASGVPLIRTFDTSCTKGKVTEAGITFTNAVYAKEDSDKSIQRASIGHIEVIEMGNLDPSADLFGGVTVADAIEHVNGVPGDCSAIDKAFDRTGGLWRNASDVNEGFLTAPEDYTSGLYGTGSIINVDAGWQASYSPVALANTYTVDPLTSTVEPRHQHPGSILPDFRELQSTVTTYDGTTIKFDGTNGVPAGFNAVSGLLMKASIMNDYVSGAGLNAQTDFVVTFPTKKRYVESDPAVPPFTTPWNAETSTACEAVDLTYWNHEEDVYEPASSDFSPPLETEEFELCYETNILHVGVGSNLFGGDEGHKTLELQDGFEAGWVKIDFANQTPAHVLEAIEEPTTISGIEGMPVIGFSSISTQNGDVGGLLSNYAKTFEHKAEPGILLD